jgi:hypothetical protein
MTMDRRQFVTALVASGTAAAVPTPSIDGNLPSFSTATSLANPPDTKVDFRYAPHDRQSTIYFPDDPRKTIVGQAGDLRYGFAKSLSAGMEDFASVVEFSLAGFQDDKILRQWIESPAVPIVHTLIDRPAATRQCDLNRLDVFPRARTQMLQRSGCQAPARDDPIERLEHWLKESRKQSCDEIRARFNL